MKTFDSGAKSSEEAPRYDLIPLASLKRQAARMAEGAKSHGERNYLKGAHDPVFVRDRINHLLGHALAYAAGDASDDHLGAILANAGMLADIEAIRDAAFISNERTQPTNTATIPPTATVTARPTYDDLRGPDLQPCRCGRLYTHPAACDTAEKCLALDHPHAT